VKRYKVEYEHLHPIWCEVMAYDEVDAVAQIKQGKFIEGTVDSDPGKDIFTKVRATLIPQSGAATVKGQE
jgi:hypothetical protein